MTNSEKFKEVFGFKVTHLGARDNEYRLYCIDAEGDAICDECPLKDKGCNEDAFAKWWQSEYKEPSGEVTE